MRRTGRRVVAVLATACSLALTPLLSAPAYADHHGPTAQDVARAKAAAAAKAEQAGQAKAKLALADARLAQLKQQSAVATANFKSAMSRLAIAQRAAARATLALQAAQQQIAAQQLQIARFAASAYRNGGAIGMWSALLTADGPSTFLDSATTINAISSRQSDALAHMQALRVVQQLAQQQAAAALATVKGAADAATAARKKAESAFSEQQQETVRLAGEKADLVAQAKSAKSKADELARERAANLAAARAAEERARQQRALGLGGVDEENPASITGGPRPPATAAQGEEAVAFAKRQLGKPYEWGADGPSTYDCSGLTMQSWASAGISIDHWSVAQYGEGNHVARADLRPGDLVFFAYDTSDASTIHHVGIYVGDGQMIDAPHTGAFVRYDDAFRSDYIGATRP